MYDVHAKFQQSTWTVATFKYACILSNFPQKVKAEGKWLQHFIALSFNLRFLSFIHHKKENWLYFVLVGITVNAPMWTSVSFCKVGSQAGKVQGLSLSHRM